jgi:hypothetical protein
MAAYDPMQTLRGCQRYAVAGNQNGKVALAPAAFFLM